jgi:DNA-binding MarR family transcriptional regulator
MDESIMKGAEAVSLFCRLNINIKRDLPVRSSEMGLLILVVKSESPVTSIMAADFFKVSKPMIAAMVASLVKKGYLEKTPSENDKRSYILRPTKKAALLVEEAYQEYFRVMELLRAKMGSDFKKLIPLLEQANEILLEEK